MTGPRLAVLAAVALAAPAPAQEPSFGGRTLDEWQKVLKDDAVPRKRRAAVVSLGQIALSTDTKETIQTALMPVARALRTDASPVVRQQAAVVIGQQKVDEAAPAVVTDLVESMRGEKETDVRKEVAVAIGRYGKRAVQAVTPLTAALKDANAGVRAAAADALGRIGDPSSAAAPELLPLVKDADKAVRQAAVFAVGRVAPEDTEPAAAALVAIVNADPDVELRREAINSLGFLNDRSTAVTDCVAAVLLNKAAEPDVRSLAALTLGKFGPAVRSVERELTQAFKADADKAVRMNAVRSLCGGFGADAVGFIPLLSERLKDDPDFEVRIVIAEELGALGTAGKPAVPALRGAQRDPQVKVREAATAAIKQIERPPPKPKS